MGDRSRGELAELVARTDPAQLLPDHFGGGPIGGFELIASTRLSVDQWLLVVRAVDGGRYAAPVVIDRSADTSVRRCVPGDGAARALVDQLASTSERYLAEGGFTLTHLGGGPTGDEIVERPMLVDQTHESVVVDERHVVKWAVRAESTPAPTLVAHLAEAGFDQMARPIGFVTWDADSDEILLASVVSFLEGASDGWSWAVGDAGEFATGSSELGPTTSPLAQVGELVADLHASLATPTSVLPTPQAVATGLQVQQWRDLADRLLGEALAEVDGEEGERLRRREARIREVFAVLDTVEQTAVIPVHGDLHVGQVLRWDGGYAVGDFDGNPVLPVSARLLPQPAARDVAGMLQALDHVGRVVDRRVDGADPARTARWITEAQAVFLDAYLTGLTSRGARDLFDRRLLLPFQVEQECREFLYAVRHLQRWRYVPDQALGALLLDD